MFDFINISMKRFEVGDIIVHGLFKDADTEILRVYKNHYHWKYVGCDKIFNSKYSNDPLFEMGWRNIKDPYPPIRQIKQNN